MSHMPQIVGSIAKQMLSSTYGDHEDYSSNQMFAISSLESTVSKQKTERMKEEILPSLKKVQQQSQKNGEQMGSDVQNYFIKIQSRKLKILYPHFVAEEIQNSAKKIWRQLPICEKDLFSNHFKNDQSFVFEDSKLKKEVMTKEENICEEKVHLLDQSNYFEAMRDNLPLVSQINPDQIQASSNINENLNEATLPNDLSTQIPLQGDTINQLSEKSEKFIFIKVQSESLENDIDSSQTAVGQKKNEQIQACLSKSTQLVKAQVIQDKVGEIKEVEVQ